MQFCRIVCFSSEADPLVMYVSVGKGVTDRYTDFEIASQLFKLSKKSSKLLIVSCAPKTKRTPFDNFCVLFFTFQMVTVPLTEDQLEAYLPNSGKFDTQQVEVLGDSRGILITHTKTEKKLLEHAFELEVKEKHT